MDPVDQVRVLPVFRPEGLFLEIDCRLGRIDENLFTALRVVPGSRGADAIGRFVNRLNDKDGRVIGKEISLVLNNVGGQAGGGRHWQNRRARSQVQPRAQQQRQRRE